MNPAIAFNPSHVTKQLQRRLAQTAFILAQMDLSTEQTDRDVLRWVVTLRVILDALLPEESMLTDI